MASKARLEAADRRAFFERICELRELYRLRGPDDRAASEPAASDRPGASLATVVDERLVEAAALPNGVGPDQDTEPHGR